MDFGVTIVIIYVNNVNYELLRIVEKIYRRSFHMASIILHISIPKKFLMSYIYIKFYYSSFLYDESLVYKRFERKDIPELLCSFNIYVHLSRIQ
jgi:hypothetical protein